MRESKFRAWWIHPESESSGFDYFQAGEDLKQREMCQEIVALEQFTGKRDKEGFAEIYESDILTWIRCPGLGTGTGVVVWNSDSASWYVENDAEDIYTELYNVFDYSVVIGNIHENPELLKGGGE